MEIEVRTPLVLDARQETQVYNHTFLNLINLVIGGLISLQPSLDFAAFEKTLADCYSVIRGFRSDPSSKSILDGIMRLRDQLASDLELVTVLSPQLMERADTREEVENLWSISQVMEVRHGEMKARADAPFQRKVFPIVDLRRDFELMLKAIEKNSLGRYRIQTHLACQQAGDYFIHIDFSSHYGDTLCIPPIVKDVLRDLIANARKYSEPGATVLAGLHQSLHDVRLVVRDEGRGIPEDELERVVEFGYRARNVLPHETKGSGLGLTKAYWIAQKMQGRMWIDSTLGRGTRVTLQLPAS